MKMVGKMAAIREANEGMADLAADLKAGEKKRRRKRKSQ